MRSNPMARIITSAAALVLLSSSTVSAQADTRFPADLGDALLSAVVTSALDDAVANEIVETTARSYHQAMGGKVRTPSDPNKEDNKANNKRNANKEQPRGGWLAISSLADTERVTQSVFDLAGKYQPNIIVVSGGDGQANVGIARQTASTSTVIDIGQPRPCVNETGQADASGDCAGSASAIPPNYTAVEFAVEDGAYLAGVLAAKASRGGRLGIISGYPGCGECERYIEGFSNGARSVNPDADIVIDYLADDETSGFGDPASAKTFTEIFLDVYQPSVLMPIGRATTIDMIEAACDAGILAIGTGTETKATRPDLDCVMLSVTKDLERAIEEAMYAFSYGENERVLSYDLANGGVGISEDWNERVAWYPVDTEPIFTEAEARIRSGSVEACPDGCGGSLPDVDAPVD